MQAHCGTLLVNRLNRKVSLVPTKSTPSVSREKDSSSMCALIAQQQSVSLLLLFYISAKRPIC